jgi:hypothetical protein
LAVARRAPLGATFALTVATVVGLFGLATSLAHSIIQPTRLPPPFAEQNQDAETILFVLTFAVLLPAALIFVPRLADRISSMRGAAAFDGLAAALLALLTGLLVLVKASEHLPWGGGLGVLAVAMAGWCLTAALSLIIAATGRVAPFPRIFERAATLNWLASLVLTGVLVVGVATLGSIAVVPLIVGCALGAGFLVLPAQWIPRLGRPWGPVVDGLVVVLLLLAVPNVVIFTFGSPADEINNTILQFHQDFFLGPVNQVMGGGAMLVDTLSQYGVGSIYFLAAAFQVLPISNGMVGLVEGVLSAVMFISAYAVLRLAGTTRALAVAAMSLAVIVLVYNLQYPLGGLLQHGAIRFGIPVGVIVAAVIEVRTTGRAVTARALGLLTVGLSSIWALEAFAYTVLTYAGILAFLAWTSPAGVRAAAVWKGAAGAVAAIVLTHIAFAGATLAATGQLPDWGMYIDTLRAFLVGGVGDLTYDFAPWSAALPIGALYVASVVGIVLVARPDAEMSPPRRVVLTALSGSTAWGIALFSYFVNRSSDHILPYICLPAIVVATLWLRLAFDPETPVPAPLRRIARGSATALAVLLVAVAWSATGMRYEQSALAHVIPGGDSLGTALHGLAHPPELAKGADAGIELLEREMPGEEESTVLTSADLGVEVLMATDRINRIPFADPWEESLVPEQHLPALTEAVDGLRSGDRVLMDGPAERVFEGYVREPERDPLADPFSQSTIVPSGIAVLQEWVLKEIGVRFRLRTVARGPGGIFVAELIPR